MPAAPSRSRRRILPWIGVSLLAHVSVLVWLRRELPPPPPRVRAPIVVTIQPRAQPAKAAAEPTQGAEHRRGKSGAAPAVALPVTPEQNAATLDHAPAVPPRTLALLSPGALVHLGPPADLGGHTSHTDPNRTDPAAELARVQARLDADNEAFQIALDTQTGARGTLVPLKHALIDRFAPPAQFAERIPGSLAARDHKLRNIGEAHLRPRSTAELERNMTPAAAAMSPGGVSDGCSASHEIGRVEARFRVEHNDAGAAVHCELIASSGQPGFDAYASAQLLEAMRAPAPPEAGDATPRFSEWLLSQVVYDWNSTAGLGCPRMERPPGRPVNPDARDPWGITYTSEITLAAVRYRH